MVPVEWWCYDIRITYQGVEERWIWRYVDEEGFRLPAGNVEVTSTAR